MTDQTPPTDRPLTAGDVPTMTVTLVRHQVSGTMCIRKWEGGDDFEPGTHVLGPLCLVHHLSRPATSAASEGEAMRLVPDRVLTDAIYWMARGYERVHSMPRVSDTELANKIEGAKAALGRARDAAALASPPVSERERELEGALRDLFQYAERQECGHEDTHRGGLIWTICDGCGKKWADDEGGFVPYVEPSPIARARALTAQPAGEGK